MTTTVEIINRGPDDISVTPVLCGVPMGPAVYLKVNEALPLNTINGYVHSSQQLLIEEVMAAPVVEEQQPETKE